MNKRFITIPIFALCVLWLSGPLAAANGTNGVIADLNGLVERINGKLQRGQTNEGDLANELNEFDALVAKHKGANSVELAEVLLRKAQLYEQFLGQPEKSVAIFKQIKANYPGVEINGNTDEVIRAYERIIAAQKIRRALVPGAKFPGFAETDLAGKPLSLESYKGKVVLIDFWSTVCLPCLMEFPEMIDAYKKYHDQGFEIIGVSLDDNLEVLKRYLRNSGLPWPQYCDGKRWDSKLALQYGVQQTPTAYLLDRDGKIAGINLRGEDLSKAIAKALGEK